MYLWILFFRPILSDSFSLLMCYIVLSHSVMLDFVFLWTVACQGPLSVGLSRQEYWSGLPDPLRGSSISRDQACVSCILYDWATWRGMNKMENSRIFVSFTGGCNNPLFSVMPSARCVYRLCLYCFRFPGSWLCGFHSTILLVVSLPLAAASRLGKQ